MRRSPHSRCRRISGSAGLPPTKTQQQPILDALGDDYDELLDLLEPWAAAIVQAGYYPTEFRQLPPRWGRLPD